MVNYKLIEEEQRPIDDIDRSMINISYDVMLGINHSNFRKKLALDVLAKFVHFEHHRKRIAILLEREQDPEIKTTIQKILDGKFQSWIEEHAGSRFGFETKKIEEDIKQEFKQQNKEESKKIVSMLPFYRYQAKHSSAEASDDDFDYPQ